MGKNATERGHWSRLGDKRQSMAHLTTANLIKLLEVLIDRPSWKVAMRSIGASEQLAFKWRAQSIRAAKDDDRSSPFFLEWRNAWDYWHNHAGRARAENVILYESVLRDQALNGVEEVVHGPDQRVLYRERSEYIGRDDDYIRIAEGLDAGANVGWYRLEHDERGHPIPLTKRSQIAAPLRLRILEQDRRYIARTEASLEVKGEITHSKPLQRRPDEPKPDVSRLRALAAMPREERLRALGASAKPNTIPVLSPRMDDAPDDAGRGLRPGPPPFVRPQASPAPEPSRPSYAKPSPRLDRGEGIGEGAPAPGGMKVV